MPSPSYSSAWSQSRLLFIQLYAFVYSVQASVYSGQLCHPANMLTLQFCRIFRERKSWLIYRAWGRDQSGVTAVEGSTVTSSALTPAAEPNTYQTLWSPLLTQLGCMENAVCSTTGWWCGGTSQVRHHTTGAWTFSSWRNRKHWCPTAHVWSPKSLSVDIQMICYCSFCISAFSFKSLHSLPTWLLPFSHYGCDVQEYDAASVCTWLLEHDQWLPYLKAPLPLSQSVIWPVEMLQMYKI